MQSKKLLSDRKDPEARSSFFILIKRFIFALSKSFNMDDIMIGWIWGESPEIEITGDIENLNDA